MTSGVEPLERVRLRIGEVIAGSSVPEDPRHSINTLEWLLKLAPGADEALQLAALGHDIDRAVEASKVLHADFCEYDAFNASGAIDACPNGRDRSRPISARPAMSWRR